jgi:hypothetical protein
MPSLVFLARCLFHERLGFPEKRTASPRPSPRCRLSLLQLLLVPLLELLRLLLVPLLWLLLFRFSGILFGGFLIFLFLLLCYFLPLLFLLRV